MIPATPLSFARTTCRVCPSEVTLIPVLDLGELFVSTFCDADDTSGDKAPLNLAVCPTCSLVQLTDTVPWQHLFRHYWYRSGINETMIAELHDVTDAAMTRVPVGSQDTVLDIGANDGTLLEGYHLQGNLRPPNRLAFEPARNLMGACMAHAESGWADAFPPGPTHAIWSNAGQVKIITAIAMAYDLDDPNAFIHGVKTLLHPDGLIVIQFQDLESMILKHAFDNICHEHLEYYTLHSLMTLLAHNDLVVYDIERRAINGGSLRCYIGHKRPVPDWGWQTNRSVLAQIDRESQAGLIEPLDVEHAFKKFDSAISNIRYQLQAILNAARDHSNRCDAYGASTKGNTLLQVLGVDATMIDRIAERSEQKFGKVTAGTRIPIVSEEVWREDPAPVTLVPIWQFREHVAQREAAYLEQGGMLVFPLPMVTGVMQADRMEGLARGGAKL